MLGLKELIKEALLNYTILSPKGLIKEALLNSPKGLINEELLNYLILGPKELIKEALLRMDFLDVCFVADNLDVELQSFCLLTSLQWN